MELTDWCYVSGRVAVLEGQLLREDFFQRLVSHESLEDVLLQLSETRYKDIFTRIALLEDAEELLSTFWEWSLNDVLDSCPHPCVVNVFRLSADVSNYKVYLKKRLFGLDLRRSAGGTAGQSDFEDLWAGRGDTFPDPLADATLRLQSLEARKQASMRTVDWLMDAAYLNSLVHCAGEFDSVFAHGLAEEILKLRCVEAIFRAILAGEDAGEIRGLFLWGELDRRELHLLLDTGLGQWEELLRAEMAPGASAELLDAVAAPDPVRLVQALNRRFMLKAREAVAYTFGPERPFGYLFGLRAEVRNLKVAVSGMVEGIRRERIQRRFTPTYL